MRLIMFDMDGTLIDTQSFIAEHMTSTFTALDMPVPDLRDMRRVIGLSLPIAMGRLIGSDDEVLVTKVVDTYKSHYRVALENAADREPLYPGTREAIDILRTDPDTILGVATGKGLSGVHRILAIHGLTEHFKTLQTPDHNPSKPHPGMLLRAMSETGAAAPQTVMIGDTVYDMETAKSAGVAAIGVTWGYHEPDELRAAGADILIDRYDQLDGAVRQLLD